METRNVMKAWVLGVPLLLVFATGAFAAGINTENQWQKDMLFAPSKLQLNHEKHGKVYIYEGIRSVDIDLAMDRFTDRIENMMFVNTVWTNEEGEPIIDSETGKPLVDNDC